MKRVLGLLLLWSVHTEAQVVVPDLPALQVGLGAYSQQFTDAFSFGANPAALTGGSSGIGLFTTRKFGVRELSALQLSGTLSLEGGGLGLRLQYAGHPAYYQLNSALAYGKQLGVLSLGVELGYSALQIPGYGNDGAVQTALGCRIPVSTRLLAGLRVANFLGGRFRYRSAERLARVVEVGLGYELSEQVFLSFSLVKAETSRMIFLFFMDYHWLEKGVFKAGINTQQYSSWMGLGWQFGSWQPLVQVNYHPVLGLSPALQLIYSLKKDKG